MFLVASLPFILIVLFIFHFHFHFRLFTFTFPNLAIMLREAFTFTFLNLAIMLREAEREEAGKVSISSSSWVQVGGFFSTHFCNLFFLNLFLAGG